MPATFCYAPPTEPWLDILYQDKDILVLHKPVGILTNPGRGAHLADSLQSRVQAQFPLAHLVHRLDLATSGLVVFALRRKAEVALKQQFAARQTEKIYIARVQGLIHTEGIIEAPLCADLANPPRNKVCFQQGKAAKTYYQVVSQQAESTLLRLFPVTGRAHQLRVHLLSIGHPILGDTLYGDQIVQQAAPRLLLHAAVLGLRHPFTAAPMRFVLPPNSSTFNCSEAELLLAQSLTLKY